MKKIPLLKKLFNIVCSLIIVQFSFAQTNEVAGTVTDNKGNPLEGVSIIAKGSTSGVFTSSAGFFKLSVPAGVKTLTVSYVGFETRQFPLSNESTLTISLQPGRSNTG